MTDTIKAAIAQLLKVSRGISLEEARDIVKETQYVVNDTIAGESGYRTPDEVIEDYLGLTADYTWVFLPHNPKEAKQIPFFEDTLTSLDNLTIYKNDNRA